MSPTLVVHDAHKTFGDSVALQGAELELQRGELLCLLGPNGAGKTTLIRAIAGRVRLDRGNIELLPEETRRDHQNQLGVVPQEVALYSRLTAKENLEAFGRLHGVPVAELRSRIEWAMEWTGLAARADDLVGTFSGGMQRRLNLACGVLHRPAVVLLDEPTVGVDPQSRARIWEMLAVLRNEGTSLLLTTHQLDEAQQYCQRIVIIDHGRTIAAGSLPDLVAQTMGTHRLVTLTLQRPLETFAAGRLYNQGRALELQLSSLSDELPAVLAQLQQLAVPVQDIQIESASLQSVFLHLTGRELRE